MPTYLGQFETTLQEATEEYDTVENTALVAATPLMSLVEAKAVFAHLYGMIELIAAQVDGIEG